MPRPPAVATESEYGRELFQELKRIREIARQHIKKAQTSQKEQYDKHSREPMITTGDLVMLKVDAKFKLDRSFRGPYRTHKVTLTCACIQPINSPDKEKIFVSLQRLSRCNSVALGDVKPWLGHGQTRKRRQVRARPESTEEESLGRSNSKSNDTTSSDGHVDPVTRSGRRVRKPA